MRKFIPIVFLASVVITVLFALGTVLATIGALAGWCLFPWPLLYTTLALFFVTVLLNFFWNLSLEKK